MGILTDRCCEWVGLIVLTEDVVVFFKYYRGASSFHNYHRPSSCKLGGQQENYNDSNKCEQESVENLMRDTGMAEETILLGNHLHSSDIHSCLSES